ncbi:aminotransferase class IV [Acetobacteraceae bacterium KSS8]|uniref:Probable branched-chain-amino-acid aminotransferase n=1 Tax=Endosaccharibacter trunci TaxID=2812733 RepID=A0ABT1W5Y7_9PROT|nr:aminotransferase class IV [Acetobacteraceae bacterium KSS8]
MGDGVFETIRVRQGRPVRLERHLARLQAGAAVLGIPARFGEAEIEAGCTSAIAGNAVLDGSLRISLSRGPAARGLASPVAPNPTLLIAAHKANATSEPVILLTARTTRRNEHSPLSRIKSLNYLDGILARREAEAGGADDALMLNTAGLVAESTAATLIAFAEDRLWTPRIEDGALPGIARQVLMDTALVAERVITPDWLARVPVMFLCNSLGVRSVSALDGRSLKERPELLDGLRKALEPDRF